MASVRCVVCGDNVAKYRCPACDVRTCTITCVKQHKQKQGCTGIRNKVGFVPSTSFSDTQLLHDYRFLEDTARTADNAHRDIKSKHQRTPHFLNKLQQRAHALGIKLKIMPYPMSKRKNNRTRIQLKVHPSKAPIDWQIEWVFPQADGMTFRENVPFTMSLHDAMMRHVHPTESEPVRRHALRRYVHAGIDSIEMYMKAEGIATKDTQYHHLNKAGTATDNLIGKMVVEYPTVYVVLRGDTDTYSVHCITTGEEVKSTALTQEERDQEQREREREMREKQKGKKPQEKEEQSVDQKQTQDAKDTKIEVVQSNDVVEGQSEDMNSSVKSQNEELSEDANSSAKSQQEEGQNTDVKITQEQNQDIDTCSSEKPQEEKENGVSHGQGQSEDTNGSGQPQKEGQNVETMIGQKRKIELSCNSTEESPAAKVQVLSVEVKQC